MKNPLRPKWFLPLTLGLGAVGALLRLWQLTKGYDHKLLLLHEHPSNILLFILSGLTLAALFFCVRSIPKDASYRGLFPPSALSAIGSWVAGLGIGYTVFSNLDATGMLSNLCTVFGIAAALGLLIVGYCRLRGIRPNPLLHTLLTVYLTLQLVRSYQGWNSETQISMLFPPVMAMVFLMLSSYRLTELDALAGDLRAFVFFRYGALFFSWVCFWEESSVFFATMALWCTLSSCDLSYLDCKNPMNLPDNVRYCLDTLEGAGFDAFVVGGCVRDSLLGLEPQDYDMCTNASPQQIRKAFPKFQLVRSGEKHGTIGVVLDGTVYEITTFRTEGRLLRQPASGLGAVCEGCAL